MSISYGTIAQPAVIDGPIPRPRPYGLLSVAQEPVSVEDGDRWSLGAAVWSYPADEPGGWNPCDGSSSSPPVAKSAGVTPPLPVYGAFQLYLPITCKTVTIGDNFAEWQRRATLAFDAVEGYGIEKEFATGALMPDNPALVRDAHIIDATGVDPAEGLALLENYLAEVGFGREGVIHADPATVTRWNKEFYLDSAGGRMRTRIGTPVAVGTGYVGVVPDGQGALAAGAGWAFVTGPVMVRRGEVTQVPETYREALDRETNTVTMMTERAYIAAWDTAVHGAILIDRT